MAQELIAGETFTSVAPGKTVTDVRLNNHVTGGKLAVGCISSKTEMSEPIAAGDFLILQDVSDLAAGEPKKVQAQNILPEIVRQQTQLCAAGTLSGGVYAVTLSPAATAYTTGMVVRFIADSANTGAVSVNVNALGNKNIFTRATAALAANDILANQIVELVYDGTRFIMLNALSAAEVTAAHVTEALRGGTQQYIADSGVAANVYAATLSPAATTYANGMVVRFKAANANTGASTLNVNGLGTKTIKKVGADLVANDILLNQMVTVIYDGTNFQLVSQARSPDYTATAALPGSAAAATFAHGLGFKPSRIEVTLMNNAAGVDQGYAQNDEVDIAIVQAAGGNENAFAVCRDATNVTVAQVNNANVEVIAKTGGGHAGITEANWVVKVRAWI